MAVAMTLTVNVTDSDHMTVADYDCGHDLDCH